MRIGVISEGHADRAVITNIIRGITGLDTSDIRAILPARALDETDKAIPKPLSEFGGWTSVRNECLKNNFIDEFLAIDGQDFVVIQIDTAECHEYGIVRPNKTDDTYVDDLRTLVISQINSWLGRDRSDEILYAIAVEEIDAWILTIFDKSDTSKPYKAKEKLNRVLAKVDLDSTSSFDNFLILSKPFLKSKIVKRDKLLNFNGSLRAFYNEIENKVLPRLNIKH